MNRPVVGVCLAVDSASYGPWNQDVAMVPATLVAALHELGWQVLLIPPDRVVASEPEEAIRLLDGLIVPDWTPRNDFSRALGEAVEERGIPVVWLSQSLLVPDSTVADYARAAEGLFSGPERAGRA